MKIFNAAIVYFVILLWVESACLGEFAKGPYLQNVTQNSIVICFETSAATEGTVNYGIGNTTDHTISDAAINTFHEVTLNGLTIDTEYMYQVTAGTDTAGATFSTAPDMNTDFRFAAYGDNQHSGGLTEEHIAVTALIETMDPDLLINVGDLWSHNTSDVIQIFFDVEKELIKNKCLFSARGNHEYNGVFPPDYFDKYLSFPDNLTTSDSDAYYSFDYGNSHFLFINTQIDYNLTGICTISDPQLTAIQNDLQEADDNPDIVHIFVVMHKAAHSNGTYHGSAESPLLSQILGPIFLAHNVDIVFQGHDHNYERFEPEGAAGPLGDPPNDPYGIDIIADGVTYVVTGAGGAKFYTEPVPPAGTTETAATPNLTSLSAETVTEAMQIDVSGPKVTATTFRSDGSILDKFIILRDINCIEYPTMDYNKDCKVNFLDLAELAAQWLICNYDPPEACYL